MSVRLFTNSRASTARRCQREHYFAYELGFREVEKAEPLRFGTLMHNGLEAWWKASEDRIGAAYAAVSTEPDAYQRAKALALMQGYDVRWGGEHLEVLAVEQEFRAPLVNPATGEASDFWRLAGKIDAVVRDLPTGRVLLVEHKTSGDQIDAGSSYWKRLKLDSQISTYYAGAKALGYDIQGCLYDVIGKPTIKPALATPPEARRYKKDGSLYANQRLTDETPEAYFGRLVEAIGEAPTDYYQRGVVVRLEQELLDSAADVWVQAEQLRQAIQRGEHPRNTDECLHRGRLCPYFDMCCGEASLESGRFRQLTFPHPELSQSNP